MDASVALVEWVHPNSLRGRCPTAESILSCAWAAHAMGMVAKGLSEASRGWDRCCPCQVLPFPAGVSYVTQLNGVAWADLALVGCELHAMKPSMLKAQPVPFWQGLAARAARLAGFLTFKDLPDWAVHGALTDARDMCPGLRQLSLLASLPANSKLSRHPVHIMRAIQQKLSTCSRS